MATECFAPVRGSAIRVTGLTDRGALPDTVQYVASKSVAKVTVSEVTDGGNTEVLRNPEEKTRLKFVRAQQAIRHKVDIEFLRVDPSLLGLIAGVQVVYRYEEGFGKVPFGIAPFGGSLDEPPVDVAVGFDSVAHQRPSSFALEVWSKLSGACAEPRWGYTLFPFLRGGRVSGFKFTNGLVSFNLIGAQTRRNSGWGYGPYDLEGPGKRLLEPVSRNTSWRMFVTEAAPPTQTDGIVVKGIDVLDNGTAANPMPDPAALAFVDGGSAALAGPWIIDGGRA